MYFFDQGFRVGCKTQDPCRYCSGVQTKVYDTVWKEGIKQEIPPVPGRGKFRITFPSLKT